MVEELALRGEGHVKVLRIVNCTADAVDGSRIWIKVRRGERRDGLELDIPPAGGVHPKGWDGYDPMTTLREEPFLTGFAAVSPGITPREAVLPGVAGASRRHGHPPGPRDPGWFTTGARPAVRTALATAFAPSGQAPEPRRTPPAPDPGARPVDRVWVRTAAKAFHAACGPGNLAEAPSPFRAGAATTAA
ncbi:hypothetical protein GCM10010371_03580 [Streptomyces subrutilus]|uniref:Uncharacterized protein n=1 Tax=Streptomyces subrutilus TaxID=36818 RepID=A0A918UZH7_9ACTN|nr:hypothetical protein GCM10010371_03580 [Streptomyces subrutilus]